MDDVDVVYIGLFFFRWRRTRNEKNSIALSSELAHTKANQ